MIGGIIAVPSTDRGAKFRWKIDDALRNQIKLRSMAWGIGHGAQNTGYRGTSSTMPYLVSALH